MTRRTRWLLLPLVPAALSCSESPAGGDRPGIPASLTIVSGDEQGGTVGQELPNALVVRVTDDEGDPIEGQLVNFRVASGGGSVFAGSALTNANGEARERWTLGTVAADSQRMEARAVDPVNGAGIVFGVFRAVAIPGAPARLRIAPDSIHLHRLGLTRQLSVQGFDRFENPIPSIAVGWRTEDAAVLSVDSAGLVTARGFGAAHVFAEASGVRDSAAATIAQQLVLSMPIGTAPSTALFLVDADGSRLTRITSDTRDYHYPDWSPDGDRILAVRHQYPVGVWELVVMNADGSDLHAVFTLPCQTACSPEVPAWSPAGDEILFALRDSAGLFAVRADGTGLRRITVGDDHGGRWSPDGRRIVFQRNFPFDPDQTHATAEGADLYLVDPDGANLTQLTPELVGAFENADDWAPNGGTILFARSVAGWYDLFAVRPDGSDLRRLTDTPTIHEFMSAWSPDGGRIAYGQGCTLRVMRADGSDDRELVRNQAPGWCPANPRWRR